MKKIKLTMPFLFTIAFSISQSVIAMESTTTPYGIVLSALVSLKFLAIEAANVNYSDDQIINIQANVRNLMRIVHCNEFDPISQKASLVTQGTCGSWHEVPWLDNKCWAKQTCLYLNWNFDDSRNDCCCHANPNDCCCGSTSRIVFWSTLGTWQALTSIPSVILGGVQALIFLGSLPFRCCGACDEYKTEMHVNKPLLKTFISQYALRVKEIVQENQISLSKEDQEELERLSCAS